MSLIIVDEDKFNENISLWHMSELRECARYSLSSATVKGIDAVKKLVEQEKIKNEVALKRQQELIEKNKEYADMIDTLCGKDMDNE